MLLSLLVSRRNNMCVIEGADGTHVASTTEMILSSCCRFSLHALYELNPINYSDSLVPD